MRRLTSLALAATALLAAAGGASAAEDGKKLYMKRTCVACHGKGGAKAILFYPNLAGQEAKYLVQQMKDIKANKRLASKGDDGNPRTKGMADIMHLVNDDEMTAIADWLSTQPPAAPKPATTDAARIQDGAALYKKTGCLSCHGPDGKKPLPAHPFVAGQKKEYIVLQMKDIRDGVRTNGRVKTMVSFAKRLDDAQIDLIADYLSTIQR